MHEPEGRRRAFLGLGNDRQGEHPLMEGEVVGATSVDRVLAMGREKDVDGWRNQFRTGKIGGIALMRRLVEVNHASIEEVILDTWEEITISGRVSVEERMECAICVLVSERFDDLDNVFVPALRQIEGMDNPYDYIEYFGEFWELIEGKLLEWGCEGLWDLIREVLGLMMSNRGRWGRM